MSGKKSPQESESWRRYGNPPQAVKWTLLIGLALGLILAIVGFFASHGQPPLDAERWWTAGIIWGTVVAIVPASVALTAIFHIRISSERVQHVLLNRFVLSDYAVSDFIEARLAERGCAVVLHFHSGRIHFLGAHAGEIRRLTADLEKARAADRREGSGG